MARQSGPFFIEGTIDNVTFYKMDGIYYVRKKSSLSGKKVLKSPRFERTRQHASQLADAARIASTIYKQLPVEERNIKRFRSIVGRAKVLLATGKDKEYVLELLRTQLNPKSSTRNSKLTSIKKFHKRLHVNKDGKLVCHPERKEMPCSCFLLLTFNLFYNFKHLTNIKPQISNELFSQSS